MYLTVNENYLSSSLCCQSPESNPPSHLIPLLLSHLALSLSASVSLRLCIPPSLQIQCGGTAADVGFSSSLYSAGPNCWSLTQTDSAALSLAGHTMLQQTAQQRRRDNCSLHSSTPPHHPLHPTTNTLKGSN